VEFSANNYPVKLNHYQKYHQKIHSNILPLTSNQKFIRESAQSETIPQNKK